MSNSIDSLFVFETQKGFLFIQVHKRTHRDAILLRENKLHPIAYLIVNHDERPMDAIRLYTKKKSDEYFPVMNFRKPEILSGISPVTESLIKPLENSNMIVFFNSAIVERVLELQNRHRPRNDQHLIKPQMINKNDREEFNRIANEESFIYYVELLKCKPIHFLKELQTFIKNNMKRQ
eukprot:746317-Hanusia_phi.AAC.7